MQKIEKPDDGNMEESACQQNAPPSASDPASDGIEADGTINADWMLFWSGDA